jgi:hypothetical protein
MAPWWLKGPHLAVMTHCGWHRVRVDRGWLPIRHFSVKKNSKNECPETKRHAATKKKLPVVTPSKKMQEKIVQCHGQPWAKREQTQMCGSK